MTSVPTMLVLLSVLFEEKIKIISCYLAVVDGKWTR